MPPPPPKTRLTEEEAVALAAADARVQALPLPLHMRTVYREGDRLVWRISSATIGMQWWVEVDDATGAVGEPHQAGQF